jgi:recombination protein RecA
MTKKCVICNSEFEAQRADAEVCSAACRQKNWRKKKDVQDEQPQIAKLQNDPPTKLVVDQIGLKEKPKEMSQKEKEERIDEVIEKINKDFGEGTIMRLGDKPLAPKEVISTGSIGIDRILGIGGFPRGRMIEIYGPESSGKTTISLKTIAEAQKKGFKCAIIDAEQSFDSDYAANLGVNIDNLRLCQPDYGEQALEVADSLIVSGEYGVVVIDSVAALIPKAELEGQMGDSKMGLQARLMSQACRKLVASINKSNTLVIFINQLRATIGNMYGPQEVTTGGNALKFYASIRLEVKIGALLKDGEETIGRRIKVKVVKSKVAPPYKVAEMDVLYGEGIDRYGEIMDLCILNNIIQKNGSWFSFDGSKLGQGRETVRQLLKDNPELCKKLEQQISVTLK